MITREPRSGEPALTAAAWPASSARSLSNALLRGLDFRLLAFWTVGMLLPTLLVATPIWASLASALDTSPRSSQIAAQFDMLSLEDLNRTFQAVQPVLGAVTILALLASALLSPLLTAAILARAANEAPRPGSGILTRAVAWYGRSFRIWLLSLIPLSLVALVWWTVSKSVSSYARRASHESNVLSASRLATLGVSILALGLHVSIEVGRAELAATPERRSATRAWLRGVRKAIRQPLRTLAAYLLPTLLSLLGAALFSVLRLHIVGSNRMGFALGLLVTQLAVMTIGWGRASRLFALSAQFRSQIPSRELGPGIDR